MVSGPPIQLSKSVKLMRDFRGCRCFSTASKRLTCKWSGWKRDDASMGTPSGTLGSKFGCCISYASCDVSGIIAIGAIHFSSVPNQRRGIPIFKIELNRYWRLYFKNHYRFSLIKNYFVFFDSLVISSTVDQRKKKFRASKCARYHCNCLLLTIYKTYIVCFQRTYHHDDVH